ncbi:MAG: hypothetical protein AAGA90_12150 [Actinomycetota bacterium]
MSELTRQQRRARRSAERKARLMTKVANRTFSKDPNILDRLAITMLEKAVGEEPEDDPELDHDGEIIAFE